MTQIKCRRISDFKDLYVGTPAIVIGNGESRLSTNIEVLRTTGAITIGCNALYRDFSPDFLIAVDQNMISEIMQSGYACHHKSVLPKGHVESYAKRNQIDIDGTLYQGLVINDLHQGWASGTSAITVACQIGCNPIYLFGFDGGSGPQNLINNIYKGTSNYNKEDARVNLGDSWLRQFEKLLKIYPEREFYQIDTLQYKCQTISLEEMHKGLRSMEPKQSSNMLYNRFQDVPAVLIGNGTSRLAVDLKELFDRQCIILGCNALYRDFSPDLLGVVDHYMAGELVASGYPTNHCLITSGMVPESLLSKEGVYSWKEARGWSTGPMMAHVALSLGCNPLYMVGFDMHVHSGVVNNVYAGTDNYAPKDEDPICASNWEVQLASTMADFPHAKIYQVGQKTIPTTNVIEWKYLISSLVKDPDYRKQVKDTLLKQSSSCLS